MLADLRFQSRAREGATRTTALAEFICWVSIHAPARGATTAGDLEINSLLFQFTRPRGARHGEGDGDVYVFVSIHAPARGATGGVAASPDSAFVSIHAPARGATAFHRAIDPRNVFQFTRPRGARRFFNHHIRHRNSFNSRAREGRDLNAWIGKRNMGVSTREGATPWGMASSIQGRFHTPRGARLRAFLRLFCALFQPRPRGARQTSVDQISPPIVSPRAREGRDDGKRYTVARSSVHPPARGRLNTAHSRASTRPRGARQDDYIPSQPCQFHHAREGRDCVFSFLIYTHKFQFTRPRGARLARFTQTLVSLSFQFTRPRGARRFPQCLHHRHSGFNSRAREGRDGDKYSRSCKYSKFQFTRPRGARQK